MNERGGRTASRRRAARQSRLRIIVLSLQMVALGVMGLGIGAVGAIFYSVSGIDIELSVRTTKESTKIYSSEGIELASLFQEEHRERVPLDQVPENLRNATVAIEDSRFYRHAGVDIRGISRALYQNIRYHRVMQGGSTITQQLARNVYLTKRKTLTRKLQEAALAIRLESQYPKDHILEVYLNQVYYGSGAYGVQTASRIYFGKNVDRLDLAESALLAGLPMRPSYYSPFVNIDEATKRRNVVLNRMAELGYITSEMAEEARESPVRLATQRPIIRRYRAGYFIDYVVRELSDRYGEDLVTGGGLRIYTTLNWRMQRTAERALAEGIAKHKGRNVGQGALIAIEPGTGHIKSMVGGTSYAETQFNRATQARRQPGSAFKAFVYTAALDRGIVNLDTRIPNSERTWPAGSGRTWTPRNYDGKFSGPVTVREALARSINIPAINVAEKVGIEEVIKYAHLLGIKSEIEPYLPAAIGGIKGLSPMEMAASYAVYASGGIYAEPMAVLKVTDAQGGVIEENRPMARRVISNRTASMMDELFRAVVTMAGGTGRMVANIPEARGKTGTTNRDVDVWFIGYVPNRIATAVWAGNDDYAPMNRVFGGLVAAPIWREFTAEALKVYQQERGKVQTEQPTVTRQAPVGEEPEQEEPPLELIEAPEPDERTVTVTVCSESRFLATRWCQPTVQETFTADEAPRRVCNIHRAPERPVPTPAAERREERRTSSVEPISLTVCTETGKIATRYCPRRETKKFDINNAPSDVCDAHQPP